MAFKSHTFPFPEAVRNRSPQSEKCMRGARRARDPGTLPAQACRLLLLQGPRTEFRPIHPTRTVLIQSSPVQSCPAGLKREYDAAAAHFPPEYLPSRAGNLRTDARSCFRRVPSIVSWLSGERAPEPAAGLSSFLRRFHPSGLSECCLTPQLSFEHGYLDVSQFWRISKVQPPSAAGRSCSPGSLRSAWTPPLVSDG